MLHIGITTAPRPNGVEYLSQLVDTLPYDAHVVIAPQTDEDVECAVVDSWKPPTWTRPQWLPPLNKPPADGLVLSENADRLMRVMATQVPFFLILQDDATPCERAYERIEMVMETAKKIRRFGWCSFYTPYIQCGDFRRAFWPYPDNSFYGDVAMLWSAEAAVAYLERKHKTEEQHDLAIQRFFRGRHWKVFGHSPCLFQHIGVESATCHAWDVGQRQTMNWRRDHDAIKHAKALPT